MPPSPKNAATLIQECVCHSEDPVAVSVALLSWGSLPVLHLVQPTARAYLDLLRARMRDACVTAHLDLQFVCDCDCEEREREEKRTQQKHADAVPMHRADDSAVGNT